MNSLIISTEEWNEEILRYIIQKADERGVTPHKIAEQLVLGMAKKEIKRVQRSATKQDKKPAV